MINGIIVCLTLLQIIPLVNECFSLAQLSEIQKLPHYLIHQIGKYMTNEYLHLFEQYKHFGWQKSSRHWKINVDEIINSV